MLRVFFFEKEKDWNLNLELELNEIKLYNILLNKMFHSLFFFGFTTQLLVIALQKSKVLAKQKSLMN